MSYPVRLAGLGVGLLLALGACDKLKAPAAADAAPAAAPPAAVAANGKDTCGAAAHQALVGTSAGSLDSATLPKGTRVIFPGMPVTMDYRQERLNVAVGKGDKVDKVYCG